MYLHWLFVFVIRICQGLFISGVIIWGRVSRPSKYLSSFTNKDILKIFVKHEIFVIFEASFLTDEYIELFNFPRTVQPINQDAAGRCFWHFLSPSLSLSKHEPHFWTHRTK